MDGRLVAPRAGVVVVAVVAVRVFGSAVLFTPGTAPPGTPVGMRTVLFPGETGDVPVFGFAFEFPLLPGVRGVELLVEGTVAPLVAPGPAGVLMAVAFAGRAATGALEGEVGTPDGGLQAHVALNWYNDKYHEAPHVSSGFPEQGELQTVSEARPPPDPMNSLPQ